MQQFLKFILLLLSLALQPTVGFSQYRPDHDQQRCTTVLQR
jgi:hypothetical protein